MKKRLEIVIDGNNFSDLEGFFCEADRALTKNLSFETGHNLNAFNDLLRGGFGVHDYGEPLEIHWLNAEKSKSDLGYKATAAYFKSIFKICHPANTEIIREKLEMAKKQLGETLFDMICGIITNTDNSGHDCTLILE